MGLSEGSRGLPRGGAARTFPGKNRGRVRSISSPGRDLPATTVIFEKYPGTRSMQSMNSHSPPLGHAFMSPVPATPEPHHQVMMEEDTGLDVGTEPGAGLGGYPGMDGDIRIISREIYQGKTFDDWDDMEANVRRLARKAGFKVVKVRGQKRRQAIYKLLKRPESCAVTYQPARPASRPAPFPPSPPHPDPKIIMALGFSSTYLCHSSRDHCLAVRSIARRPLSVGETVRHLCVSFEAGIEDGPFAAGLDWTGWLWLPDWLTSTDLLRMFIWLLLHIESIYI